MKYNKGEDMLGYDSNDSCPEWLPCPFCGENHDLGIDTNETFLCLVCGHEFGDYDCNNDGIQ